MADAAALAGQESAEILSRVRVIDFDGVTILSSDEADNVPVLAVVDGQVSHDDTADIKGTANLTISIDSEHESLVPMGPGDPLSPIAEVLVQIEIGARDPATGLPDLDLQGTYEIIDTDIEEDQGPLTITLELEDKHKKIQRARFFRPRTIAKGTAFEDAQLDLLVSVIPESEINITPTTHTTPLLSWDIEDDRLAGLREMQVANGYIMRFDGPGNAQIHPDTDPTDDPIWSFSQGPETVIETVSGMARALKTSRRLSDRETYNGVIALGEPTGDTKPRIRAEAWDTNPDSLTYFDPTKPDESRYGPVPFFYSSTFITTPAQGLSAARAMLPKKAGVVERIEVTTLLNARVRCGDVALINRPRIGASGSFVVEAVTKPIKAGSMSMRMRERRLFA